MLITSLNERTAYNPYKCKCIWWETEPKDLKGLTWKKIDFYAGKSKKCLWNTEKAWKDINLPLIMFSVHFTKWNDEIKNSLREKSPRRSTKKKFLGHAFWNYSVFNRVPIGYNPIPAKRNWAFGTLIYFRNLPKSRSASINFFLLLSLSLYFSLLSL